MEAAPPSSSPPWIELPGDLTANILRRLGVIEILESAQKVCNTWRRVCQDPAVWQVIEIRDPFDDREVDELHGMCRHAVDRSQGHATDIFLDNFGDDELMNYISKRSTHLRRLTLASCYDISGECLSKAVKKFSKLEELSLVEMSIEPKYIESIGISCPAMKSFKYYKRRSKYPPPKGSEDVFMTKQQCNEYAVAIAKSMPNLRHLGLFANSMTSGGLKEILDCCTQLESLDIRQCFNLDLRGDFLKRCRKQIKHLRLPSDSTDDYEFDDGDPLVESSSEYSDGGFTIDGSPERFDSPSDFLDFDDFDHYEDYTNPYRREYFPGDGDYFSDPDYF